MLKVHPIKPSLSRSTLFPHFSTGAFKTSTPPLSTMNLANKTAITIAIFLGFFASLKDNPLQPLDNFVRDVFYYHDSTQVAWFGKWSLSSPGHLETAIIGLVIGSAILIKNKRHTTTLIYISSIISMGAISYFLKEFTGRARPETGSDMASLAWPSGHTMLATVMWGSLLLIVFKEQVNKKLAMKIWLIIITITACGRMLGGVHWFTDVVGGFLIGVLIVQAAIYFDDKKSILVQQ